MNRIRATCGRWTSVSFAAHWRGWRVHATTPHFSWFSSVSRHGTVPFERKALNVCLEHCQDGADKRRLGEYYDHCPKECESAVSLGFHLSRHASQIPLKQLQDDATWVFEMVYADKQKAKIAKDLQLLEVEDVQVSAEWQHNLICLDGTLDECVELTENHLKRCDSTEGRVRPTCLSRCARGGKTTTLLQLWRQFKQNGFNPIFLSFNGSGPVSVSEHHSEESLLNRFCRTLALALAASEEDKELLASNPIHCRDRIEQYLQQRKHKKMVVLIDELNQLIRESHSEQGRDLAHFLKRHFLSPRGRHMVFSTHRTSTSALLSNFMESDSARGVDFVRLPVLQTFSEVHNLKLESAAAVTPAQVAMVGRMPGLLVTLAAGYFEERREAFLHRCALRDCTKDLPEVLDEVIHGWVHSSLGDYHAFTDGLKQSEHRWILAYLAVFFHRCKESEHVSGLDNLGELLDRVWSAKAGDGQAWESLMTFAVALRCLDATLNRRLGAFSAGAQAGDFFSVQKTRSAVETLEEALVDIRVPHQSPATVLVIPSHARFRFVDLFVVRFAAGKKDLSLIAQFKTREGVSATASSVPEVWEKLTSSNGSLNGWTASGGAFWICGQPRKQERKNHYGKGWTEPSLHELQKDLFGKTMAEVCNPEWLS